MKKSKWKLIVIFLLCISFANSQTPNFVWAKSFADSQDGEGKSITVLSNGDIVTTGYFQGTIDLDSGPGVFTITSSGGQDVYIVRTDLNGNFVWGRVIGGASADQPYAIDSDANDNIFVTGSFFSSADFDPGPGTYTIASIGSYDIFVLKLNSSGNFVWAKSAGGANVDNGLSLAIDGTGNVLVTGEFQGSNVDFDPGPGSFTLTSLGSFDAFIWKLDNSGNFTWVKQIGGISSESGISIDADASGNVYSTGRFFSVADFDPGPGTFTATTLGNEDIYVSKLDASGNFVWAKFIGGNSADQCRSLFLDQNANIYMTGFFSSVVDFDPGVGTYTIFAMGGAHMFVCKWDGNGNFQFANGILSVQPYAITADSQGNCYTTGWFSGTTDFDTGPGTYTLTGVGEVFVLKNSPTGNITWAYSFGAPSGAADIGYGIRVHPSGYIYTTGRFNLTSDFDPGAGTSTITALSGFDPFIHKMNQCQAPADPTNVTPVTNQTLCAGASAVISATSTGATINWYSSPSSTLSLFTGTNYTTPTLTANTFTYYAEASTCTISAGRTPVTVTVYATPVLTLTSSGTAICVGESATLSISGANNYTWSTSSNSPSISVSPTTTSIYSVTGINNQGCSSNSSYTLVVNLCTDVTEYSNDKQVAVYPNPSSGSIVIRASGNARYKLFDMKGQELLNGQVGAEEKVELKRSLHEQGIYLLQLLWENETKTVKIIVE